MPTSGHAQFFKITFYSFPTHNLIATCGNARKPQPSRHSFKIQIRDCRLNAFLLRYACSCVIQRLKAFASGLRLLRTRAYKPDSLMKRVTCSLPWGSLIMTPDFSSSSSLAIAWLLFPSPNALHTSAATNHGSLFDRPPHAKIKNRNRLFLSEMVSGTGAGAEYCRVTRHLIRG